MLIKLLPELMRFMRLGENVSSPACDAAEAVRFNSQDDMLVREVPFEVVWYSSEARGKFGLTGVLSMSFYLVTKLPLPFDVLTGLRLL